MNRLLIGCLSLALIGCASAGLLGDVGDMAKKLGTELKDQIKVMSAGVANSFDSMKNYLFSKKSAESLADVDDAKELNQTMAGLKTFLDGLKTNREELEAKTTDSKTKDMLGKTDEMLAAHATAQTEIDKTDDFPTKKAHLNTLATQLYKDDWMNYMTVLANGAAGKTAGLLTVIAAVIVALAQQGH